MYILGMAYILLMISGQAWTLHDVIDQSLKNASLEDYNISLPPCFNITKPKFYNSITVFFFQWKFVHFSSVYENNGSTKWEWWAEFLRIVKRIMGKKKKNNLSSPSNLDTDIITIHHVIRANKIIGSGLSLGLNHVNNNLRQSILTTSYNIIDINSNCYDQH